MKTLLTKIALIFAGVLFVSLAGATVHKVTMQSNSFSPSSFSASVGDTVEWDWINGGHTTTSTGVPNGATTWTHPMNNTSTTFQYKITVAGTYNYWCAIHTTMMEASFTATAPTGVSSVSGSSKELAQIFPNPATDVLNIRLNNNPDNTELVILDLLGKEIIREPLTSINNSIDISTWRRGIYLYQLRNNEQIMEGKFEVE